MAIMSSLRKQNPKQNQRGHSIKEFSSLLSEMQAGNADRSRKLENNRYSANQTMYAAVYR